MAMHVAVATPLKTGTVVLSQSGTVAPSADFFKVEIIGKSCHGASPQNGVDALSVAAHTVVAQVEGGDKFEIVLLGKGAK